MFHNENMYVNMYSRSSVSKRWVQRGNGSGCLCWHVGIENTPPKYFWHMCHACLLVRRQLAATSHQPPAISHHPFNHRLSAIQRSTNQAIRQRPQRNKFCHQHGSHIVPHHCLPPYFLCSTHIVFVVGVYCTHFMVPMMCLERL